MRLYNSLLSLFLVSTFVFLTVFTSSCILQHKSEPYPVYSIYIEKEQFPPEKLPVSNKPNPFPEGIIRTFLAGDNMILDIGFSEIKKPITFSRYVLINLGTSNQNETLLPGKLGPFGPRGRDGILQIKEGPWPVPDKPGIYELRVYFEEDVVASAKFQVKSAAYSNSETFPRDASLEEAVEVMKVDIPKPHYLPEGYEIQRVVLTSNTSVSLMISNIDDIKIELEISWRPEKGIPFKLVPPTVDFNGNSGSLLEGDNVNALRWNWRPEPSEPGFFILTLSASKNLPIAELILIAKTVGW